MRLNPFTRNFESLTQGSTVKKLAALYLTTACLLPAMAALHGINLPPMQGTSETGAFLPGIYNYSYQKTNIQNVLLTFNAMRLPINVETANNPASLQKLKAYIDQIPQQTAIICMFDTLTGSQTGHGDGRPNNLAAMGAGWKKIHATFASYRQVRYEIFNEPFGYSQTNPAAYVNDMKTIIAYGELPESKCILDGMGYADNINLVVSGGWSGELAYHFYPTWSNHHTQAAYSNRVQTDLGTWGQKTWITEFGANLGWTETYGYTNSCYNPPAPDNRPYAADVNCLRGLDDALQTLKAKGHGVKGTFYWHGWPNGDTYNFWSIWNSEGACKVKTIQQHD
jgi:hypothetical protein